MVDLFVISGNILWPNDCLPSCLHITGSRGWIAKSPYHDLNLVILSCSSLFYHFKDLLDCGSSAIQIKLCLWKQIAKYRNFWIINVGVQSCR